MESENEEEGQTEGEEEDLAEHEMHVDGEFQEDSGSDVVSELEESDEEMDIDLNQTQIQYPVQNTRSSAPPKKSPSSQIPSLSLEGGFQWSTEARLQEEDDMETSSDEEGGAGEPSKKKRKRKEIEHDLTANMHSKAPESNADFERLLLGSPNSSYLWIQYMSFQLPLSEVDKAREIARRAIKTINFREEKEKLNIWIALMNLENVYGTDESLDAIFKEAARANDSKTIHLRLATIFDQSDKSEVNCCLLENSNMLINLIESRGAVPEDLQKVWPEFQSLDTIWRIPTQEG